MREIVVISGKGGTGKTSVTAAFASLTGDAVLCDLDVDASDLHILLAPEILERAPFSSGNEAVIVPERCENCGVCVELCRFGAIRPGPGAHVVESRKCEGCKVCVELCPAGAVEFPVKLRGEAFVSRTRFGTLVHARLIPGEENSGRLVAQLRRRAREIATAEGRGLILCDGSPGVGCPVISSLTGADMATLVTEPTLSGASDLERALALCAHFRIPAAVILNKSDLNPAVAARIEAICAQAGAEIVARPKHDMLFFDAMSQRLAVTELADNDPARELRAGWTRILELADRKAGAAGQFAEFNAR